MKSSKCLTITNCPLDSSRMTELAFEFGYKVAGYDRWLTGFVRAVTSQEAKVIIADVAAKCGMTETYFRLWVPDVCLPCNAEFFG